MLRIFGQRTHRLRGFTLIEMVVVLAIIGILTSIIITGQSAYNRSLILTDTAYTIAFSVRQAQFFGLSSRGFSSSFTNIGYGVSFSSGALDRYTLFADTTNTGAATPVACTVGTVGTPERKPGNCRYNAGDGIVKTYVFNSGYHISKFCGKSASGLVCSDANGLTSLDLAFLRPNTVSVLTGTQGQTDIPFTCAEIHLAAPDNSAERVVRVSSLGEISTGQTCP